MDMKMLFDDLDRLFGLINSIDLGQFSPQEKLDKFVELRKCLLEYQRKSATKKCAVVYLDGAITRYKEMCLAAVLRRSMSWPRQSSISK